MAISSIHIEAGNIGFFSHNDRSRPTKNSIFSDEKNFVNCSSREAIKIYKDELEKRTQAYLKNHSTRKKLHSKTHTHLSAIVNLNKEHTPDDLKKVVEHIEKTFDTKVLQFSIHKDEGHISDDGESIKNYHAHIEMMGLDSEGNSIKRQLHRKELIALQSATAELLGMERGTNYSKERKPRPKRLNTYEYKESKEQESKAKRATAKDLKGEIKQLREQLQEQGAVREQYAELEALNRELKERVKAKDLSIEELRNLANRKIKDEYRVNRNLQKLLSEARETILEHKTTIDTQKEFIERLRANISVLEHKVRELESELKGFRGNDRQSKRREVATAKKSLKSDKAELSSLLLAERSEISVDDVERFIKDCEVQDRIKAKKYLRFKKALKLNCEAIEFWENLNNPEELKEVLEQKKYLEEDLREAEQELLKTGFKTSVKNEVYEFENESENQDEENDYRMSP